MAFERVGYPEGITVTTLQTSTRPQFDFCIDGGRNLLFNSLRLPPQRYFYDGILEQ